MRQPKLTTREKLDIVEKAINLIRKPENWTQGYWKKVVYTKRGQPVYAYCLDGAIAEAAQLVLGEERALKLGVEPADPHSGSDIGCQANVLCARLSVVELAHAVLVQEEYEGAFDIDGKPHALDAEYWAIEFNDARYRTHKQVLTLLCRKARELRAAVKTLDERKAAKALTF